MTPVVLPLDDEKLNMIICHGEEEDNANGENHKETKMEGEHRGSTTKDISHFQAEINMKHVDTFDAVVSLKMGEKRNNLRFKYVRGEHEHDNGENHGGH